MISAVTSLWSIVLQVIGIRELHDISTGRAILALFLPLVALIFVLFVVAGTLALLFIAGSIL